MRAALLLSLSLALACTSSHAARRDGVTGVRLAVARELVDAGEYRRAIATIQQIHESGGRSPDTLTLRAVAYRRQGLADEAEADLREALRLDRDHAPAHATLAVLHDDARRFAESDKEHRRAIDLDPKNAAYLNDWGYALYQQGRIQDAIARMQQAVALDPTPPQFHNNLGFAYARAGDFTRAAQQFAQGGTLGEAMNNLGYAYELEGNLAQAFDMYREAVRLAPGLARARSNLEAVARKLDREIPADLRRPEIPGSGGKQ